MYVTLLLKTFIYTKIYLTNHNKAVLGECSRTRTHTLFSMRTSRSASAVGHGVEGAAPSTSRSSPRSDLSAPSPTCLPQPAVS